MDTKQTNSRKGKKRGKYNVTKLIKHVSSKPRLDGFATDILTYEDHSVNIQHDFCVITVDSEWSSKDNDLPLTVQIYIPKHKRLIIILNKDLEKINPESYSRVKSTFWGHGAFIYEFLYSSQGNSPIMQALEKLSQHPKDPVPLYTNYRLVFYYSPKDVILSLGDKAFNDAALNGYTHYRHSNWVMQRNMLMGRIKINPSTFHLYDLVGCSNAKNFVSLAGEYGVEIPNKSSMELYKERMAIAMLSSDKNIRSDFVSYAIDDAKKLAEIYEKRIEVMNDIIVTVLKLDPKYIIKEKDFPNGVGKLVELIIKASIQHHCETYVSTEDYLKTIYSVGHLDPLHTKYSNNIIRRRELLANNGTSEEIEKHFNDRNYTFNALSLGSIQYLLSHNKMSFAHKASFVTGGRTDSARYKEIHLENVVDIDAKNAYGESLNSLCLPLGKPVVYTRGVNDLGYTLKQFRHKYRHSLEPGTYKIIVNGDLKFDQDFIYSRILPTGHKARDNSMSYVYNRLAKEEHDTETHTIGDSILLRNQIINGCLTHNELDVIDKVASNLELKGFNDLIVDCCVYYPKEKKCSTVIEWVEKCNLANNHEEHYWYPFQLNNITSKLLAFRTNIKKEITCENDEVKKTMLSCKEQAIKLINNSNYGVIASPLFKTGNSVIAENVTSLTRSQIWLASKALYSGQIITDGFMFQPSNVLSIKEGDNFRLPGFHLLSDLYRLKASRYVVNESLGNIKWNEIFEKKDFDNKFIEALTQAHVNKFFNNYGIKLIYTLEIKRIGKSAGQFLKSHYAIDCYNYGDNEYSDRVYKLRGCKEYNHYGKRHPMYYFFDNILDKKNEFPADLSHARTKLLKIATWKIKVRKNRTLLTNRAWSPGSMVSDPVKDIRFHARHYPVRTKKEFFSRKRSFDGKHSSFHVWKKVNTISDMVEAMDKQYAYTDVAKK